MSIAKAKIDILSGLTGINTMMPELRMKFNKIDRYKLMSEVQECKDELIEYIDINSYTMLPEILGNYEELREINIEDIKVSCYFWIVKERKLQGEVDLNIYYGVDHIHDDVIYSEPARYRYTLIIGGKEHGKFIINAEHPDNDNTSDIVYELDPDSSYEYMYFKEVAELSKRYYDKQNRRRLTREIEAMYVEKCIRNQRIKMLTELYTTIADNYSLILSYNKKGKHLYNVIIRQSGRLLNRVTDEMNKIRFDPLYSRLCKELYELITMVKSNMIEWYENVDKCIYSIANNMLVKDIRHHIISFV